MMIILTGCTSTWQNTEKPEVTKAGFQLNMTSKTDLKWLQGLEKEFMRYWTLRYTDQFESAYAMEAPQLREAITFNQYKNYVLRTSNQQAKKLEITRMEAYDSSEGNKIADIGCRFYLESNKDKEKQVYIEDKWIRINGKWYHGLRNQLLFPGLRYE
jgi:hypothetical protein